MPYIGSALVCLCPIEAHTIKPLRCRRKLHRKRVPIFLRSCCLRPMGCNSVTRNGECEAVHVPAQISPGLGCVHAGSWASGRPGGYRFCCFREPWPLLEKSSVRQGHGAAPQTVSGCAAVVEDP